MEKLQSKMWAGTYHTTTLAISILMKRPNHHKVNVKHGNHGKVIEIGDAIFFRLLARERLVAAVLAITHR